MDHARTPVLAAIDDYRRSGHDPLDQAIQVAPRIRRRIAGIPGLIVPDTFRVRPAGE